MKITLRNIKKSFGAKTVIDNISMEIDSGSFTTLLGCSGCGKTTLLRMISGLETPDFGEILFDDKIIFSSEKKINIPSEKRNLGFVFQDFALWPHLNVFENVAFGLRAKKKTADLESKVIQALKCVHLEELKKSFPSQLSGGQQQRVAFARAIVTEPECILFDEPLSALDAILREEMRNEITDIVSRLNITSVFVTHDQSEAMSMSSKIAVMDNGKIAQYDVPEKIYTSPSSKFVARFIGNSNWIDENHMFRPENILTENKSEKSVPSYVMTVESAQFLGDKYKIRGNYNGYEWCVFSSKKMQAGQKINLFVNEKDIICV